MKRSRRSNRFYARTRRLPFVDGIPGGAGRRGKSAAELAGSAGLTERAVLEPLEARQLLFSLTITPADVNPATGVGTVFANFGYVVPYINTDTDPDDAQPQTEIEDFNDEQGVPRGLNSPTVFLGSNLQLTHTIAPDLVTGAPRVNLATDGNNENFVRLGFSAGETFTFRLTSNQQGQVALPVQQMSMFIGTAGGGGGGLNPNQTLVELRLGGELVGSFTGAELAALGPGGGGAGVWTFTPETLNAFDEIRFTSLPGASSTNLQIDNVSWTTSTNPFASILEERIFGARVAFTGPVGATVQFLDLYGRDMRQVLALGRPADADIILVDPDGDGVPNFNDGIGKIIITNSDARTALTLIGGTIEEDNGAFVFNLADSLLGIFDELEEAGFGYAFTEDGATGLPPGPGSVVVGSPYVRPQGNYNPAGAAPGATDQFTRSDQGVFVQGGRNVGGVYIHGVLHGNSQFTGAADRLAIGYLVGSITVNGDLGSLLVGSDAGTWELDPDGPPPPPGQDTARAKTGSRLTVGRSVGEIVIAGRSLMDVTVVGDLNSPNTRPARDAYRYFEREAVFGFDPNVQNPELATLNAMLGANTWAAVNRLFADGTPFFNGSQGLMFADGTFRNDTIMGSEFVNSITSGVQIYGELGARDPANPNEDLVDVYGFATDGRRPVVVELQAINEAGLLELLYARIVDHNGRTVAAMPAEITAGRTQRLRFNAPGPGVYYLVLMAPAENDNRPNVAYTVTMGGLASVTLGSHRTGSSFGSNDLSLSSSISVLAGNIGSVRVATGYVNADATEADPIVVFNDDEEVLDERQTYLGSSVSVPGNLFNVTAGGDIVGSGANPVRLIVGGDFGTLVTGLSPVTGIDPTQGDLGPFNMQVGGRIAFIDVKGAIGINQDADPDSFFGTDTTTIRSGTSGRNGDIGMIRVGGHVAAGRLTIATSNNSTVGGFLVSQDIAFDPAADDIGIYNIAGNGSGVRWNLGAGSDVRFADAPRIDLANTVDAFIPLVGGQFVDVTDDSGEVVRIQIIGAPDGAVAGRIIALPVNGSQGSTIAQIIVDLSGGARLQITGRGADGSSDVFSIGRIVVTNADAASSIGIVGNDEIDIWLIQQTGGTGLVDILNSTPRGDIVAVDVAGLTSLTITSGDLGRTQLPSWGPRQIGPFLGIGGDDEGGGLAPLELNAGLVDDDWNGELYRPVNDATVESGGAYLDDIGSPLPAYLNGLLVRAGDITSVSVGGAVGDVIAQAGNIITVRADADGVTPNGRFDGIVGVIAALGDGTTGGDITLVEIGDGLARRDASPISTTGIFAADDIETVTNTAANPDAFISSTIASRNINADETGETELGTFRVELKGGGDYTDAFISVADLDRFWGSLNYGHDDDLPHGAIFNLGGTDADFFRSDVVTGFLQTFELLNGFFDASRIRSVGAIGRVEAAGFRNSTIAGSDAEFQVSSITAGGDLATLTTTNAQGDMQDLVLDILGSITNEISARNLSRVDFDVDNVVTLLRTGQDLRGSRVVAGQLADVRIGRDVRNSIFSVAGPITSFTVDSSILNTTIGVSGPNGRIVRLTARNNITGDISATSSIGSIIATNGNIIGSISTGGGTGTGDVDLLQAGRDLDITTDIAGDVNRLVAGRHIGGRNNDDFILIRGDLGEVDASRGQLFTDLRIGGSVTDGITLGGAVNKPGQRGIGTGSIIAFGRIERVEIGGDFGGDIVSHSGGIGTVLIEDGSFLPGALIAAYDGNITRVTIDGGNLYGNIHADYTIVSITVRADDRGVFGDIGVNPEHSSGDRYNGRRNELPPGVAADPTFQGPRITAGHNLGRVTVENGTIFEGFFHAGRAIGTILVEDGDIRNDDLTSGFGTVIAAGSLIFRVLVSGDVFDTQIISGLLGFGADGRPGGDGSDADTVNRGRIILVDVEGDGRDVVVSSGMDAGDDGEYNTSDDRVTPGRSMIGRVRVAGDVDNVSAYTDLPTAALSAGVVRGGVNAGSLDADIVQAVPGSAALLPGNGSTSGFHWQGSFVEVTFTGPGRVYLDEPTGRLLLINTNNDSSLTVNSSTGVLTDFDIVTNDDASVGRIVVNAAMQGDSDIVIDGFSLLVRTGAFSGTGDIRAGMNIRQLTTGSFTSTGEIEARWINRIDVNGNFGSTAQPNTDDSRVDILAGRTIAVSGTMAGVVNVDRSINFRAGQMSRGNLRVGDRIVSFRADSVSESQISANNRIESVEVSGDVFDTSFLAGGDLGPDAAPGGGDDQATTGSVGTVEVGGDFRESDIIAGALRGPDGFFGTGDDTIAAGRGDIESVVIGGTRVGSDLNSEQYRIAATGSVGQVTIGGQAPGNGGNFRVDALATEPLPIRVRDVAVSWEAGVYVARISFNQQMDGSTIGPALTISEVRQGGLTLIQLEQGTDYTVAYDEDTRTAVITFSRTVTDRDLNPDGTQTAEAGPGVYRFELEADTLRAAVADARLDGDADGVVDVDDDFSEDDVVGDAGDKVTPERATDDEGNPIDFYGPVDLDLMLDQNANPDGLPETNVPFTIRGVIGDHPDHNTTSFQFAGDTDVYAITLRAGQILRLGQMSGAAVFTGRFLVNEDGQVQGGVTDDSLGIAANQPELFELTGEDAYFIKTTGTYFLVLGNTLTFNVPGEVPNPNTNITGDYAFTLEIFDDFDSGFAADTNSGDGAPIVNAPNPGAFAGNDGELGTGDDRDTVSIGNFTFRLDDGVVTGTNGAGTITSIRRANGTRVVRINSAIGPEDHRGVPADNITPDVDVYHFNNRQEVQPGTRFRVTVQLSREGADLGSRRQGRLEGTDFDTSFDFSGNVQLGLFDTTGATNISDALLVFSPTDFSPNGGTPGVIADNGRTEYGYDENGDFYIEFLTPGRIDAAGNATPASYALYVQGIFNSNYTLQIEQLGRGEIQRQVQNVFIETEGGLIRWLEAGGLPTSLDEFDASSLGFTGAINGQPAQQYILQRLVSNLNTVFDAAGLDIRISLNAADFEFQDFSTVFLTSSNDPVFAFNDRIYGVSEHSDALNADRNDQAAVFVPSFSTLGLTPSRADADAFADSLTAAVGRRIGELLGLRTTAPDGTLDEVDIMASSSVELPGNSLLFPDAERPLSHPFDLLSNTNFFLGQQDAVSLLDKYLAD